MARGLGAGGSVPGDWPGSCGERCEVEASSGTTYPQGPRVVNASLPRLRWPRSLGERFALRRW